MACNERHVCEMQRMKYYTSKRRNKNTEGQGKKWDAQSKKNIIELKKRNPLTGQRKRKEEKVYLLLREKKKHMDNIFTLSSHHFAYLSFEILGCCSYVWFTYRQQHHREENSKKCVT